jgi:hypothetical protein
MIFIAMIAANFLLNAVAAPNLHLPLSSKEEVAFLSRQQEDLLFIGKPPELLGAFDRSFEKNPDLKNPELYAFPEVQEIKMGKTLCQKITEIVFHAKKQENLKVGPPQLVASHTGKVCELTVQDSASYAKFREKRMIAGFIKTKAYALVFRIQKNSTTQIEEGAHAFWETLR